MKKSLRTSLLVGLLTLVGVSQVWAGLTATEVTSSYTPTQIVNGNFDVEPWMTFTYNGKTYTSCKGDINFSSDGTSQFASSVVFNGVDGGWNTTETSWYRSTLFEYCDGSEAHTAKHNATIPSSDKYVEMNCYHAGMLYQDLTTHGGDIIRWTLDHAVRDKNSDEVQPMRVEIGAPNRDGNGKIVNASGWANNLNTQMVTNTVAQYRYNGVTNPSGKTYGYGNTSEMQYLRLTQTNNKTGWWNCKGVYIIPEGQTVTRFGFISEAVTPDVGNLLDNITFSTLLGNLKAVANADGSATITGYWGDSDNTKRLMIKIGNNAIPTDMSSVINKNFSIEVPAATIGDATSITVYHQDYPDASKTVAIFQTKATEITSSYTPTQIVNGNFDVEPWMTYTYQGTTYTSCPHINIDQSANDAPVSNVVFNGVNGGWNTTELNVWNSNLFEYTFRTSGTHSIRHNSSIPQSDKYIEMNCLHSCMLYQDLTTKGGDIIRWTLDHAVTQPCCGINPVQPMRVEIGAPNRDGSGNVVNASGWADNLNTQMVANTVAKYRYDGVTNPSGKTYGYGNTSELQYLRLTRANNDNGWWNCKGVYVVPEGQTVTRFGFISEAETPDVGNLLDNITFSTLLGNLKAVANADGSATITGYWGDSDITKRLMIKIGDEDAIPTDMSSVINKNFSIEVPAATIGDATSITVYHQDYPTANQTITITPNLDESKEVQITYGTTTLYKSNLIEAIQYANTNATADCYIKVLKDNTCDVGTTKYTITNAHNFTIDLGASDVTTNITTSKSGGSMENDFLLSCNNSKTITFQGYGKINLSHTHGAEFTFIIVRGGSTLNIKGDATWNFTQTGNNGNGQQRNFMAWGQNSSAAINIYGGTFNSKGRQISQVVAIFPNASADIYGGEFHINATNESWGGCLDFAGADHFIVYGGCFDGKIFQNLNYKFYAGKYRYNYVYGDNGTTLLSNCLPNDGLSRQVYSISEDPYFYEIAGSVTLDEDQDNSAAISQYGTTKSVYANITRGTLSASHYNALCLPFDMTAEDIQTYFGACDIKTVTAGAITGTTLKLTLQTVSVIEAGKAYIIKPATDVVLSSTLFRTRIMSAPTPATTTIGTDINVVGVYNYNANQFASADYAKRVIVDETDGTFKNPSAAAFKGLRFYIQTPTDATITEIELEVINPTGSVVDDMTGTSTWEDAIVATRNQLTAWKHSGSAIDLTINRSFVAGIYNTFCLPFNATATQIATAFGCDVEVCRFVAASVNGSGDNRSLDLQIEDIGTDVVPAGTPILVKPENDVANPVFKDVIITYAEAKGLTVGSGSVEYIGLITPRDIATEFSSSPDYLGVLTTGKLAWADATQSTGYMKGFRGIFHVKSSPSAAIRRGMTAQFVIGKGITTGIDNVNINDNEIYKLIMNGRVVIIRNGVKYDLNGRRL